MGERKNSRITKLNFVLLKDKQTHWNTPQLNIIQQGWQYPLESKNKKIMECTNEQSKLRNRCSVVIKKVK